MKQTKESLLSKEAYDQIIIERTLGKQGDDCDDDQRRKISSSNLESEKVKKDEDITNDITAKDATSIGGDLKQ